MSLRITASEYKKATLPVAEYDEEMVVKQYSESILNNIYDKISYLIKNKEYKNRIYTDIWNIAKYKDYKLSKETQEAIENKVKSQLLEDGYKLDICVTDTSFMTITLLIE